MTYIELIKSIISKEVARNNGSKPFIDSLFRKTKGSIETTAEMVGLPQVDEETLLRYFETAKREYLSTNPIDPGISHSLTKKGFKTWLTEEREAEVEPWNYSERYFRYLLKSGRPQKVVDETKISSLNIIRKVADPKGASPSFVKGIVVGAVQMGKTGNFNAVINRAIDSGYKLIIVLSGLMEDLRVQTQKRIESDVIGEGNKGVGKIVRFGYMGNSDINQVKIITSEKIDFNSPLLAASFSLNDTNILVCKKNVSILRNLLDWLLETLGEGKKIHNIPFLLLDDEADNASLNNLGEKGKEYASRINSQIRALLALFNIKTYLGYTATPFANVLQDRNEEPENRYTEKYKRKGEQVEKEFDRVDNIFPDDFIELLEPPSNYVGAKQIFETIEPIENETDENEKIPLVALPVDDSTCDFPTRVYETDGHIIGIENFATKAEWDEKVGFGGYLDFNTFKEYRDETRAATKNDSFPVKLPESLKDAIKCFILSIAVRESRRPYIEKSELFQPHNTMLVHVSRFTSWQNTTRRLTKEYVDSINESLSNDLPSNPDSIYSELEKIWYKYYAHIIEHVKRYLPKGYEDEFLIPIVFDSLKKFLPGIANDLEVKAINSETKEKLEYPSNSSKKIIAIGGNRLSRGFTLEGLTINYFIRATNYSDTLLQMGRWFGYRPGYIDCCKVFTTQDSLDKFNSTTRCIEELEGEFKKMERQGKEPRSFVLRVRKHPGTLKITRPSILKNAKEVKWSYQDQLEMTTQFSVRKQHIDRVWKNFKGNIAPKFVRFIGDMLTFDATPDVIIDILKNQPNNFEGDSARKSSIVRFIELCKENGLLSNWRVALKTTGSSNNTLSQSQLNLDHGLTVDLKLARRSGPKKESFDDYKSFINKGIYKASGKNANIVSSNLDLAVFLSEREKNSAKEEFYAHKTMELMRKNNTLSHADARKLAEKSKTIPEKYYRAQMSDQQALLVVYLFDSRYVFNQEFTRAADKEVKMKFQEFIMKEDIDITVPLVGYAIGFPPISEDKDPGGTYMQGDYDLDSAEEDEIEIGDDEDILID